MSIRFTTLFHFIANTPVLHPNEGLEGVESELGSDTDTLILTRSKMSHFYLIDLDSFECI